MMTNEETKDLVRACITAMRIAEGEDWEAWIKGSGGVRQIAQSAGVELSGITELQKLTIEGFRRMIERRKKAEQTYGTPTRCRAECDMLVTAPARDNPLLAIEQLRGRVLRLLEHKWKGDNEGVLNDCFDKLDARHLSYCGHPQIERWRTELVAYERAEYQREKQQREASYGETDPQP
jgi:hypothetical protein